MGDEEAFPLFLGNVDEKRFSNPHKVNLDRTDQDYADVLSWSHGKHYCSMKHASQKVMILVLDEMNKRIKLSNIVMKEK